MKKINITKIIFAFFIMFLLVINFGCTSTNKSIQKSIHKTQTTELLFTSTPQFIPTPTKIPLSDIDLKTILLLEGDLPTGYFVDPFVTKTEGTTYEDVKNYQNFLLQRFSKENEGSGNVTIFLLDDLDDLNQLFIHESLELEETGSTKSELTKIGDYGLFFNDSVSNSINFNAIIFVRCHAFVSIVMATADTNSTIIQNYAMNLDGRITKIICE